MKLRKLNLVQRLLLKQRKKEEYKNYKFMRALENITHPLLPDTLQQDVHFKHDGNIGDIIYSIPSIYALAKDRNIHLHLNINQKANYGKMQHPFGDVMLTEKMVNMLKPLLLQQKLFNTCDIYTDQFIDFDLTKFREYPFNYKMGSIIRWYFLVFGISYNLGKPWLQAIPDSSVNNAIIIARSKRYRMPGISYNFLEQYPRVVFVGLEEEYKDMIKQVPKLEYKPVNDFMELASIISGGKFFIGNQSFPFSVAEGLKVKRLLEVFHQSPNVIVEGEHAYDFCYQPQFEKIVRELFHDKSHRYF